MADEAMLSLIALNCQINGGPNKVEWLEKFFCLKRLIGPKLTGILYQFAMKGLYGYLKSLFLQVRFEHHLTTVV